MGGGEVRMRMSERCPSCGWPDPWQNGEDPACIDPWHEAEVFAQVPPVRTEKRYLSAMGDVPCATCGTKVNPVWWVDSTLWNSTVRTDLSRWGGREPILCPACFMRLVEARINTVRSALQQIATLGDADDVEDAPSIAQSALAALDPDETERKMAAVFGPKTSRLPRAIPEIVNYRDDESSEG